MDNRLPDRPGRETWYQTYPRGWPILLFVLTAAVTLLSVVAIERADRERRQLELERNATEIATGLQRRAAENIAILAAGAAMFETRQEVTYEEFNAFSSGLYSQDDYHGSLGMGWARVLDVMVVPGFEAAMRVNLDPDFVVFPRPDPMQRITIPIMFLSPQNEANHKAIGFDLYSEPTRRAAMEKAISLRQPVMSGPVNLIQDRDRPGTAGFLLFMPVFQNVAGQQRIMGFVYSPFRASEFLKAANELSLARDVEIALYDEKVTPDRLLAWHQLPGAAGPSLERRIPIGHHLWILKVSLKRTAMISRVSQVVLIAGLLLGLLVMIIAQLIIRRASEDRRTLELMTQQASIRNSLTRELNHRVKNTLANVLSIVALTRRRSTDIDDFADSLGARLRALSATHDLLSQTDWSNAPVGEIVRSELAPYMGAAEGHVTLDGPEDISLAPKDAMSLGLAIHELATNAAKYGALSLATGNVSVTWHFVSPDLVEIRWRESGGPPVAEPDKRGFGRDLIEKIVAHELHSKVDLQFKPEGVECTLQVPVRKLGDFALRAPSMPA